MNDSRTWVRRLVYRNIQVTVIMIGYTELHQGFVCQYVEKKLN